MSSQCVVVPIRTNHQANVSDYLDHLFNRHAWLRFVCLSTGDGRTQAMRKADSRLEPSQVSAMTSAYVALGQSFAKSAMGTTFTHSVIVTSAGAIVAVRVPTRKKAYVLSVASDSSEPLALSLRASLDAADEISHLLEPH